MNFTGRADMHMHTNASDGVNTVQEVLDFVEQYAPLDVIAITDHDHIDSSLWAYEHRQQYSFDIVPGMEVTTAEGHVLAWWVTELIPARMSLAETAAAIHEQGGIAVLAHPLEPTIAPHTFLRYLRQPHVLLEACIDAVEIWNAGSITPGSNWLAQHAYADVAIPKVGNSDAHMIASIGSGSTRFAGRTADDLRQAIQLGQTVAEGNSWPITTYWKLLRTGILNKRSASSEMKSAFVPQAPM